LGGADGDGELRAAPLKNAIRYWWRITQGDLSPKDLLKEEQKLFGGVIGEATRSLVDVVVTGSVRTGGVKERDKIGEKNNPEVKGKNVPLSAYLGMGPVDFHGKYNKRRILPGEKFTVSVFYPKENKDNIIDVLSLFAEFGSLGARSRNGWGSFNLLAEDNSVLLPRKKLFENYCEELSEIFKVGKKYPFKLGKSNTQPLFWRIGMENTWEGAMKLAGESYMDLRQQVLPFPKATPKGVQKRHILGYPITNHKIDSWGWNNGRMPSQLRIIIRKTGNQYYSYFFHLPHKIPKLWELRLGSELSVWQEVHKYLDGNFERTL
jgi:CRISPR-associated protein Cmr1